MEISIQQIITLFIILLIQFSPFVLASQDEVQETKSSIRNPISRQYHQVVTTYKYNPTPHSWSVNTRSTHTWTVPVNSQQPDQVNSMSNSNLDEHLKQLQNMIQNQNQNEQPNQNQNPMPKPNPTDLPKQPQNQEQNPTDQHKQPQNTITISNPSQEPKQTQNTISNPTEQPKQSQHSTPNVNPSHEPKQPQNTHPNPTEKPKQPQDPNPSPSPIEQPKQPQIQKPNPSPPHQPKQSHPSPSPSPPVQPKQPQNPSPSPTEQPKQPIQKPHPPPQHPKTQIPSQQAPSPSPHPSKKPDTHPHKSPFHPHKLPHHPFKNHNHHHETDLPPKCSHSEVEQILKVHNQARVHESEPVYIWDEELADFARHWAKKRIHDCKAIHSYGPYGENIFWGLYDHWTIPKAVQSWINEEKDYDKRTFVCQPGKLCGHYTQVVWRDSTKVGCARLKCAHGLGYFITCNYDPPGNYPNENPFESHNDKY